jgi:hypothetical protein
MMLSEEAIITLVGIFIAIPPTALIIWKCLRWNARRQKLYDCENHPSLLGPSAPKAQIIIYV